MMKQKSLVLLAIIILITVAGCTPLPPAEPPEPAVETQLIVTTTPQAGKVGEKIEFGWEITAEEGIVVMSTAIRYGTESTTEGLGKDIAHGATTYDQHTTAHMSVPLPDTFTSSLYPTSEGTLYYRFHAVVAGENYWSDEYSVEVAPLEEAEEPEVTPEEETPEEEELEPETEETTADLTIIINDFNFSPNEATINAGDTVQWINNRTVTNRGVAMLVRGATSQGYFGWKSPNIYNGEVFKYNFGEEGKLVYVEAVLVNTGIMGTITINP